MAARRIHACPGRQYAAFQIENKFLHPDNTPNPAKINLFTLPLRSYTSLYLHFPKYLLPLTLSSPRLVLYVFTYDELARYFAYLSYYVT